MKLSFEFKVFLKLLEGCKPWTWEHLTAVDKINSITGLKLKRSWLYEKSTQLIPKSL